MDAVIYMNGRNDFGPKEYLCLDGRFHYEYGIFNVLVSKTEMPYYRPRKGYVFDGLCDDICQSHIEFRRNRGETIIHRTLTWNDVLPR